MTLAAIGTTAAGFRISVITAACTSGAGRGGEGGRGALTGTGGNAIGSIAASRNTPIDRARRVDVFSDARVGTIAVRTPTSVACATTLSHKPLLKRERDTARVSNRASFNRSGIGRTQLQSRSVPCPETMLCAYANSKRGAAWTRAVAETAELNGIRRSA